MEKEKTEMTLVHLRALRRKYFALKRNQSFVSDRILRIANDFEKCDFKGVFDSFAKNETNKHYFSLETIAFSNYCKKVNNLMHLYNKKHNRNIFVINLTKFVKNIEACCCKKLDQITDQDLKFFKLVPGVTVCYSHLLEFVDMNEVYKTLLTPEWNILSIQDQFEDAYFNSDYAIKAELSYKLGIDQKIAVIYEAKNVIPFIKDRINELLAH